MTDMNMIPQNIEAEQSVLGGMMLDSGSDRCQTAMSMLKPESFYIRPHQVIFAEMRELVANQKPIDLITLIESLESKGLASRLVASLTWPRYPKTPQRGEHRSLRHAGARESHGALRHRQADQRH
jgi:hypothetical protein